MRESIMKSMKADKKAVSKMGHNKKFMTKRGDQTSKLDHKWQGKKGGSACL